MSVREPCGVTADRSLARTNQSVAPTVVSARRGPLDVASTRSRPRASDSSGRASFRCKTVRCRARPDRALASPTPGSPCARRAADTAQTASANAARRLCIFTSVLKVATTLSDSAISPRPQPRAPARELPDGWGRDWVLLLCTHAASPFARRRCIASVSDSCQLGGSADLASVA